jgi:hypothetical protein
VAYMEMKKKEKQIKKKREEKHISVYKWKILMLKDERKVTSLKEITYSILCEIYFILQKIWHEKYLEKKKKHL